MARRFHGQALPMKKSVIVVSANGGIGTAITQKLIDRGHRVVATVSRPEKIADFSRVVPGLSGVISLDLSDFNGLKSALEKATEALGRLDGLVVCGAVS